MKKYLIYKAIPVLIVFAFILLPARSSFSWDGPTHAYIAKTGEAPRGGYLCGYYARISSIIPDFAWYLQLILELSDEEAQSLHDSFAEVFSTECMNRWNYLHDCFEYGAQTHICADDIANTVLECWIPAFLARGDVADDVDPDAAHLAFEYAVGTYVVYYNRMQLWDLIFLYRPAKLVECVVKTFPWSLPFDISREFKNYMTIMRLLEKAAKIYGPFLIGEVGEEYLDQIDITDLLPDSLELSDDALSIYLEVLYILITYPSQIRETITAACDTWGDWDDIIEHVIVSCAGPS